MQSLKYINGKELSSQILNTLKSQINPTIPIKPTLSYILVGENKSSSSYIRLKTKACNSLGIEVIPNHFPVSVSESTIIKTIDSLNLNPSVHGILVQLPLPSHIGVQRVLDNVLPSKDVDGLNSQNFGKLALKNAVPYFLPCTPNGCIHLLKSTGLDLTGKHAVVLGRSNLAGLPLALMLQNENATVTHCHSFTHDLPSITRQADVLCVAVGKPHFVKEDMVKEGATVIDIGINFPENSDAILGDVDKSVVYKANKITPVPGGVGPMTIAMLLSNVVQSWQYHITN